MNEQELEKAKNQAYHERDMLLAALCKFWYAAKREEIKVYRTKHPESDTEWEQDWRNIIVMEYIFPLSYIDLTSRAQMSWHIHDSELPMFAYLPLEENRWDGHTTQRKYNRLLEWSAVPLPVILDMTKDL